VAIVPSNGSVSVQDLIANVKKGIFLEEWDFDMDFQLRNGYGYGKAREIVNGKLGATLTEASTQFSSLDIWKNVTALGGAAGIAAVGVTRDKGEPNQKSSFSASAPPMTIANLMLISQEGHF
jgi:predicted Zn-dependent protease